MITKFLLAPERLIFSLHAQLNNESTLLKCEPYSQAVRDSHQQYDHRAISANDFELANEFYSANEHSFQTHSRQMCMTLF